MSIVVGIDPLHPDIAALRRAAEIIQSGGLVVYPTETLYGIGADATNDIAVRKVHEAKHRTDNKPILVVANSMAMVSGLVEGVSSLALRLMQEFWPGPLTLVFRASVQVPAGITQGTGTVGMRIPSSLVCCKLIEAAGVPLTSTSANISGTPPATTIQGIQSQLGGIDLFLDAGVLPESLPSTVVDVSGAVPRVLRNGAVPFSRLQQAVPDMRL